MSAKPRCLIYGIWIQFANYNKCNVNRTATPRTTLILVIPLDIGNSVSKMLTIWCTYMQIIHNFENRLPLCRQHCGYILAPPHTKASVDIHLQLITFIILWRWQAACVQLCEEPVFDYKSQLKANSVPVVLYTWQHSVLHRILCIFTQKEWLISDHNRHCIDANTQMSPLSPFAFLCTMGWYTVKMCVTYTCMNQAMIGIEFLICQLFNPFGLVGHLE